MERRTILFGGLTWKHEILIKGALEALGYRCEYLPTPDLRSFQIGKEYCNIGFCNPSYFTVGNLIKYLQGLEERGLSREEILKGYVFVTAGSCGPCRFGMYESEYRLALRNSGFEGFPVVTFQQSGDLDQGETYGIRMDLDFFVAILNAIVLADVINELAYRIRPYEVRKGETDRVLKESMEYLYNLVKGKGPFRLGEGWKGVLKKAGLDGAVEFMGKLVDQTLGTYYTDGLKEVAKRFSTIEIDPLRVKPVVKIVGEFWAQTTEGDGNFNMFSFLEEEGAEVRVEPVSNWISFMIHKGKQKIYDRKGLKKGGKETPGHLMDLLHSYLDYWKVMLSLNLAEWVFKRQYSRCVEALGRVCDELKDQQELARMAHPFFHTRTDGGEGHLEVAKNIYYSTKGLAHMVLSLKPFGCMPSTQSDGAQIVVTSLYPDSIFLPIETSGEGEVNAHSRVQMALGEARVKAKEEFERVLRETGITIQDLREYIEKRPEMKDPLLSIPSYRGIAGRAASFARFVGERMGRAEDVAVGQYSSSNSLKEHPV